MYVQPHQVLLIGCTLYREHVSATLKTCAIRLEMAQQVSLLATNPDNLSLIPGSHLVEGQN